MYSFAQRDDTKVVDEPLYGHYLQKTGALHPGREEILASMETDGERVVSEVILGDFEEEVLFLKQMTHHLVELDNSFLDEVINVILIRNPYQLIGSFHQIIKEVTMTDIGVEKQYSLFNELRKRGQNPVVIDSGEILKSPEDLLCQLCEKLGIGFQSQMLSWKAGPRPEDGVWAKHWYSNVHKTTGFEKQETSTRELPPELIPLYEECVVFYEKLYNESIKS